MVLAPRLRGAESGSCKPEVSATLRRSGYSLPSLRLGAASPDAAGTLGPSGITGHVLVAVAGLCYTDPPGAEIGPSTRR